MENNPVSEVGAGTCARPRAVEGGGQACWGSHTGRHRNMVPSKD